MSPGEDGSAVEEIEDHSASRRGGMSTLTGTAVRAVQSMARRGRAQLAPVVDVVSPLGLVLAGLAAVLAVTGVLLGWREPLALAAVLVGMLAIAALFLLGRAAFVMSIELAPRRVVAGERAIGRLLLRNMANRASSPVSVEVPVGDGLAVFSVPALAAEEEREELFAVPTERRAVILAGPARSVRGDALGIFRRAVPWTPQIELFVHPRTTPVPALTTGLIHDLEGQTSRTLTDSDMSFHALREYVTGDDVRHVHWRSTARTGTLMIRQFEQTRRSQVTIMLPENGRFYASTDEFELAVSLVASLAVQIIREGTPVSVVASSRRLRTHGATALLDDSCRLELADPAPDSLRAFARTAMRGLPDPHVVILVTGSLATEAERRSLGGLFGPEVSVLALAAEPGAAMRRRRAAGVSLVTIGELPDLVRTTRSQR